MIEFERVLMLDQRLLEPSLGPKQQALGNPSERMSRLERDCFLDCVVGYSNPMLPAGFPVGKRSRWSGRAQNEEVEDVGARQADKRRDEVRVEPQCFLEQAPRLMIVCCGQVAMPGRPPAHRQIGGIWVLRPLPD